MMFLVNYERRLGLRDKGSSEIKANKRKSARLIRHVNKDFVLTW